MPQLNRLAISPPPPPSVCACVCVRACPRSGNIPLDAPPPNTHLNNEPTDPFLFQTIPTTTTKISMATWNNRQKDVIMCLLQCSHLIAEYKEHNEPSTPLCSKTLSHILSLSVSHTHTNTHDWRSLWHGIAWNPVMASEIIVSFMVWSSLVKALWKTPWQYDFADFHTLKTNNNNGYFRQFVEYSPILLLSLSHTPTQTRTYIHTNLHPCAIYTMRLITARDGKGFSLQTLSFAFQHSF